ncbi:translation initiation factor IF-2-like [Peromyscus californicus insignis]|uniref:translation initiation factor IF-2-like n=1 Tax=Peromyscus californicus insignis TaxID=564181 RepID=UPI0022A73D90|nr:translation initiation factor IF-2-like [Peromyscus californicus insignis]
MPTFFGQLRSQLSPLLPRRRRRRPLQSPAARPAPTEAARSERSPGPRHPRRRGRRRAPSSASLQPPLPARPAPLGPPPTARGPSQTPWARDGCSGRKDWPRLGPGRRGCERGGGGGGGGGGGDGGGGGGGGAPGTVSPATRRGRARRDAGSSRSAAGARRRRRWWWRWRWRRQREPRDRSITGSHGARAFSSLGAGARLGTRPGGGRAPAPGLLRRAAGRARERRGELASSSPPAGCLGGTVLLPRPAGREGGRGGEEGGGRGRRWLLSRRRPDGAGAATAADAVQRNESYLQLKFPNPKRSKKNGPSDGDNSSVGSPSSQVSPSGCPLLQATCSSLYSERLTPELQNRQMMAKRMSQTRLSDT